jgi:hypothetical protein
MKECKNCRKQNPNSAQFCDDCGSEFMKECTKCGKQNPEDARFCEYCGKTFISIGYIIKKILIYGSIAALAALAGIWLLTNKPEEEKDELSSPVISEFVQPALGRVETRTIIRFLKKPTKEGKAMNLKYYTIEMDSNRNWKYRQGAPEWNVNIDSLTTYIETIGNTNRTWVCDKEDIESINDVLQKGIFSDAGLKTWDTEKEDFHLFYASVPASYRDNGCLVEVTQNKTIFYWLTGDKRNVEQISAPGYGSNPADIGNALRDAIKQIPSEHKEYFFTAGYRFKELSDILASLCPSVEYLTMTDGIVGELTVNNSEYIRNTAAIYQKIIADSKCLVYRKYACPAIGYLLCN